MDRIKRGEMIVRQEDYLGRYPRVPVSMVAAHLTLGHNTLVPMPIILHSNYTVLCVRLCVTEAASSK